MNFRKIIDNTGANECLECGKCTGSCPLARVNPTYSPRLMVERALMGFDDEIARDWDLWSCLTCGVCSSVCPSQVSYTEFIKRTRGEAVRLGHQGTPSHDGVLQRLMALQSMNGSGRESSTRRDAWTRVGKVREGGGEYYYFAGCLPQYEIYFEEYGAKPLSIAEDALRILNAMKIEPVVSPDERCCGHDLLWNGDEARFKLLAEKNVALMEKTGAKKAVFSCPECYWTFKKEIPERFGALPFEPVHITELLAAEGGSLEWKPPGSSGVVTFHDPCRLGRYAEKYDEPRQVLGFIPGVELEEMLHNKAEAICCGTSGWINCTTMSRLIRDARLGEAKSAGASTLITACAKCRIHFRCTQRSKGAGDPIEIKDIVNIAAESLGLRASQP